MPRRVLVLVVATTAALLPSAARAAPPTGSCEPAIVAPEAAVPQVRFVQNPCAGTSLDAGRPLEVPSGRPTADPACVVPLVDDRCEAWASARFDGPGRARTASVQGSMRPTSWP